MSTTTEASSSIDDAAFTQELRDEAQQVLEREPALCFFLKRTALHPHVDHWMDMVIQTMCHRLLPDTPMTMAATNTTTTSINNNPCVFCPESLRRVFQTAFASDCLEVGHTLREACYHDLRAIVRRDPAMSHELQVILFSKGFAATVCHRVAHRLWHAATPAISYTALYLQSQVSAIFGVDIHPAAQIGAAVLLDHGTGIVVGETATIGDGCTLLHGVTLGGTGKETGDRHPKVGRDVLIGAQASLLGNIRIGDRAKIGAGSVVLREIPTGVTAVGAPAKIIGRTREAKPGSDMDEQLQNVSVLHRETSKPIETMILAANATPTLPSLSSVTDSSSQSDDSADDFHHYETSCCPWRTYAKLTSHPTPPGTVSAALLKSVLSSTSSSYCSNVYPILFALDHDNVGHVPLSVFQKDGAAVLAERTDLAPAAIDHVVQEIANKVQQLKTS